jgi:membrane protease YdiL (CAAX protease family)
VARLAAVSALLFGVPHFLYHLGHVEHFERIDQVLIVGMTGLGVLLPLVILLVPARRVSPPATP